MSCNQHANELCIGCGGEFTAVRFGAWCSRRCWWEDEGSLNEGDEDEQDSFSHPDYR